MKNVNNVDEFCTFCTSFTSSDALTGPQTLGRRKKFGLKSKKFFFSPQEGPTLWPTGPSWPRREGPKAVGRRDRSRWKGHV